MTVRSSQPLIGVIEQEAGEEVIHYFTDEQQADEALGDSTVQQVLNLAGAWKDLDSAEALDELDRIRHDSPPTPPIDVQRREPTVEEIAVRDLLGVATPPT